MNTIAICVMTSATAVALYTHYRIDMPRIDPRTGKDPYMPLVRVSFVVAIIVMAWTVIADLVEVI